MHCLGFLSQSDIELIICKNAEKTWPKNMNMWKRKDVLGKASEGINSPKLCFNDIHVRIVMKNYTLDLKCTIWSHKNSVKGYEGSVKIYSWVLSSYVLIFIERKEWKGKQVVEGCLAVVKREV